MPPYVALTVGQLVRDLAQAMGDLIAEGNSDSGSTTTLVDAILAGIFTANDDEALKGAWLYGIGGTMAGKEQLITGYTAATGTITWTGAATSPSSDTDYIVTRTRPTRYLRALQQAQHYLTDRKLDLEPVIGRESIVGNLVPNGMLDLYTTANVPDGLTLDTDSEWTRETTITFGHRRALKGVTDGTLAGFVRYAIPLWGKFLGRTVRAYALVRASTASRVTLEFSDGVTTTTDTLSTNNVWELLDLSVAFGDAATQAQVSIEISAGSAVTVYLQLLYVADPLSEYEEALIDVDRRLVEITKVVLSSQSVLSISGRGYAFDEELLDDGDSWSIVRDTEDTPRKLRLALGSSRRGRVVEYHGWKSHAEFTAVTVTYGTSETPGRPGLILPRARVEMLRMLGADGGEIAAAEAEAVRAEGLLAVGPGVNRRGVH